MERALMLAERGRGRTTPNPIVGAVIVSTDGVVVGSGYHHRAGEPHAEVHALVEAGARARGATLYCTLEPCCHTGRTGPCVERIVAAGVRRAVIAVVDPNPLVRGGGLAYLREHGVETVVGVCAGAAGLQNAPFFTFVRTARPFVTIKIALSQDGRIAAHGRTRVHITSPAADRRVQALRAEVDAVGVGSETFLSDDPLLTARGVFRERPLTRVVFDRTLRVPITARMFTTGAAGPIVILTTRSSVAARPEHADALRRAGALVEEGDDGTLATALRRLGSLGVTSLLLEGGARLHETAWRERLVDRVHAYVSTTPIGDDGIPWTGVVPLAALERLRVEPCGPDIFVEGYVHRID
jgi:diaminohydroxyphosphoribosylaminopyrimidine deaminase/5-amino-6-(5-phosphoribosylamino)uracil reductase